MLDRGDAALFDVPEADFARELSRMNLVPSRFHAIQSPSDLPEQTQDVELTDLATALKKAKRPPEDAARVIARHRVQRDKLRQFLARIESKPPDTMSGWSKERPQLPEPGAAHPAFPELVCADGLPAEFADYFEGAMAWHNPALSDKAPARAQWEKVLALPEAERKYKSTWAAFMLGKSWEYQDPEQAIAFFQQVRALAKRGFADSLGLAAASLGLEARLHLRAERYAPALKLYLEQFSTGDSTALSSLWVAGGRALNRADPATLAQLMRQPDTRRLLTALLVSIRPPHTRDGEPSSGPNAVQRWLAAAEAADVRDLDSAEKLALAAYQEGEFETAERWIRRASESPVAQWLKAKLLLRAGKVEQAAALLAKVSRSFPVELPSERLPTSFAECLRARSGGFEWDLTPAGRHVQGELGALLLARRQFAEALDALLRSGYWMDAAYVAERVLTVDELKRYVDREWPAAPLSANEHALSEWREPIPPTQIPHAIRYLLARRLTRLNRGFEAREYFPREWQPAYDALMQSLTTGWDETQTGPQRAKALFVAACITRTNGLELVGTEVEPDWAIYGGDFEEGVTAAGRTNESYHILRASTAELRRAFQHKADPEERFHYRYQAAFLGWEAAKLLPDNSDETARVLCAAGSWLKSRDPETADLFYKALVRRCRKTAIGDQADRMRWFPVLDANGNPKPWTPKPRQLEIATREDSGGLSECVIVSLQPVTESNGEIINEPNDSALLSEPSAAGYVYVVHSGDTLPRIVSACNELGLAITVQELRQANPGLDVAPLRVGQKLLIPAVGTTANRAASRP